MLYRELYRGVLWGLLRGILGVQTMAHRGLGNYVYYSPRSAYMMRQIGLIMIWLMIYPPVEPQMEFFS